MKISQQVYEKLLKDGDLRLKIMNETGVREGTIQRWAYRKTHSAIRDVVVLKIIMEYTGWTEEEIIQTADAE